MDATQDPTFKSWFGNSTLMLNGKPQILFHGTSARPFNKFEFKTGKRFVLFSEFDVEAKGFFFTEHPAHAREYGPNVVACYVRLLRPFVDPRTEKALGVDRLTGRKEVQLGKIVAKMIEEDKYGKFIDIGVRRYYLNPQKDEFPLQWAYHGLDREGLNWDILDNPQCVKKLVELGYDGSWVAEPNDPSGRSVFVVSPDQIRLAEWNKFDKWIDQHPLDDEDDVKKYKWYNKKYDYGDDDDVY
jgi:hypothetical protein